MALLGWKSEKIAQSEEWGTEIYSEEMKEPPSGKVLSFREYYSSLGTTSEM